MRMLFVVQRYGHEVAGGAEAHCRDFATRLAARGHQVSVATTCAVSYVDWANEYPPGTIELEGVTVHRFPVDRVRDQQLFWPMGTRVLGGRQPVALHVQREWMRLQGPYSPGLVSWLGAGASNHDVVIFFTYLYYTTWAGLPVASGRFPTVLHPTAHDEPPLYLPLFADVFQAATALAFSTEEERELVIRQFRVRQPSRIVGIGIDVNVRGDPRQFRSKFALGQDPYLLYVGRIDPAKGCDELYHFFATYKRRNSGPLKLVMVGEPVQPVPHHPDIVVTGFVDDATKAAAVAGSLALVQPSYFESFSMVLAEAWAQERPALVQGRSDVLVGQARRAGGAIPYEGFAEFECAVDLLATNQDLGRVLGQSGRRYVEDRFDWDRVLGGYERFLNRAALRGW